MQDGRPLAVRPLTDSAVWVAVFVTQHCELRHNCWDWELVKAVRYGTGLPKAVLSFWWLIGRTSLVFGRELYTEPTVSVASVSFTAPRSAENESSHVKPGSRDLITN